MLVRLRCEHILQEIPCFPPPRCVAHAPKLASTRVSEEKSLVYLFIILSKISVWQLDCAVSTYLRKSHTSIGKIYFWTATIHQWRHLLAGEFNKRIIINYFTELSDAGLITIFAFVVMPNHVHLIWRQNKMNGKETPFWSFLKYTAHDC
ncbi:MAG: transposase [Ferruginibacter sp.]|nr:transposase [Ferruginibacter sp.]